MRNTEKVEQRLRSLIWRYRPEYIFGGGLTIVFTRNSSTLISLSHRGPSATLRIHTLFSSAPDAILESIVLAFFTPVSLRKSRELRSAIMDFVGGNRRVNLATTTLPPVAPPRGRVYDLDEICRTVVERYVPERRTADSFRAGWSRRSTPALMGKWIETPADSPNLIVINRLLDDRRVPRFYLEYIVYHEVLHDLFPIRRRRGRWVQHPIEFRRRERAYPWYFEALRWEREELKKLTSSRLDAPWRRVCP